MLTLQALDLVKADLDGLAAGCGRVDALLAGTRSATAGLLAETDRNEKALAASEARSNLVERFLQQYQLSSTELVVLQVGAHQSCTGSHPGFFRHAQGAVAFLPKSTLVHCDHFFNKASGWLKAALAVATYLAVYKLDID